MPECGGKINVEKWDMGTKKAPRLELNQTGRGGAGRGLVMLNTLARDRE